MAKIVHITTAHPALDIRIFQKQCRTLARAGHEVALIAPRAALEQTPRPERIEGVAVYSLPMPKNRRRRMLRTTRLAIRAALAVDADLYHLHDPELLPLAHRLPRTRPGRSYSTCTRTCPMDILTKPWIPAPLRRPASLAASLVQRFLLSRFSVVLAEDSYAADHAWLADATVVRNMPLVEELLAIEERAPSPTQMLGYMGSISPARGSLVTLEAMAILRRRGLVCGLKLVGPISNARQLARRAEQLGLDDVQISGWLPAQEAWRLIAPCRAGLALLQDRPNFRRSLPTKMFEYMALGLPVVVSDFPLYRKIVESAGCGLCVDPADPASIAAALSHLLKNPAEAAAMGRRGRQAVIDHYRWDEEARRLLSLYDRLLPEAGGRMVEGKAA